MKQTLLMRLSLKVSILEISTNTLLTCAFHLELGTMTSILGDKGNIEIYKYLLGQNNYDLEKAINQAYNLQGMLY